MKLYYSHGRTAFKYGLKYLGLKKDDKILIPEYICDVVIDPLQDLKIKPILYKVEKNFKCNLESIEKNFNKSVKALLLVNYFGFEENKKKYFNFCKSKGIFLIEDSCHSLNIESKKSQKLSDFIFYSPKKIIPEIYSGGLLQINRNNNNIQNIKKKLDIFKVSYFDVINIFLENNFLFLKRFLKFLFIKKPTFHKFNSIKNKKLLKDLSIDNYSLRILNKIDLNKVKKLRLKNYNLWKKFFFKNDSITFINRSIEKNTIPWVIPIYTNNKKIREKLFNYGWKNGYGITSWPTLPLKAVNNDVKKRWNNLICINTDKAPKNNDNF